MEQEEARNMNLLFETVKEVAVEAGKLLLTQTAIVNSHKTKNDLLTENDLMIENFIIGKIREEYPDINIVSEEYNPDNLPKGETVIIDPIDGTCNFAAGLDLYGVQLAIMKDGACLYSVLYFPESDNLFTAEKGKGAFLNGKRLVVNDKTSSRDGMLIISDYYDNIDYDFDNQFELVKRLQKSFLKTRHFGAACVDFSFIAQGRALAYITYYHKIWDIAPGLLLAQEAGCVSARLGSEKYEYGKTGLVVANNPKNLRMILESYAELQ